MHPWATLGLRAALVTGGLLMLCTVIGSGLGAASAAGAVHPDRPAPPIDDGAAAAPIHQSEVAAVSPGNEEAESPRDAHPATGAGDNVGTVGEWGGLTGDLTGGAGGADRNAGDRNAGDPAGVDPAPDVNPRAGMPVVTPEGVVSTLYRVPVEMVGRAVDTGFADLPAREDDTTPRLGRQPGGRPERNIERFEHIERLHPADQVPALPRLFGPARPAVPPPTPMELTQAFPVLSDGLPAAVLPPGMSDVDVTQRLPVIPAAVPAPRNTPVAPANQSRPNLQAQPRNQDRPQTQARPRIQDGGQPQTQARPPMQGRPQTQGMPHNQARPQHQGAPSTVQSRPGMQPLPMPRNAPSPRNTPFDPGFQPMRGELPMSGPMPPGRGRARNAPTTSGLPDLPPVPTLPAMPPLPNPNVAGRPGAHDVPPTFRPPRPPIQRFPGPVNGGLPTGGPDGRPAIQDAPAGAAEQLMAQLRGLISELEESSGQLRPLDVNSLDEPGNGEFR